MKKQQVIRELIFGFIFICGAIVFGLFWAWNSRSHLAIPPDRPADPEEAFYAEGTIKVKAVEYIGGVAGMDETEHVTTTKDAHKGDVIFKLKGSSINNGERIKVADIDVNGQLTIKTKNEYIYENVDRAFTTEASNTFSLQQGETIILREEYPDTTGIYFTISWQAP